MFREEQEQQKQEAFEREQEIKRREEEDRRERNRKRIAEIQELKEREAQEKEEHFRIEQEVLSHLKTICFKQNLPLFLLGIEETGFGKRRKESQKGRTACRPEGPRRRKKANPIPPRTRGTPPPHKPSQPMRIQTNSFLTFQFLIKIQDQKRREQEKAERHKRRVQDLAEQKVRVEAEKEKEFLREQEVRLLIICSMSTYLLITRVFRCRD